MKLVFVHGWSVTTTETYGELPEVLVRHAPTDLCLEIENLYLGEYISFHDEVRLEDIARAFEAARQDKLGDSPFACITHSTGGPLIRLWAQLFFQEQPQLCPMTHLVMLAPANHGSALAILGKSRIGRIKAFLQGTDPGIHVLEWLQLGSYEQWNLNRSWLNSNSHAFYPFVLSGEKIDTHFYDFVNSYLTEKGSDGVIRLCAANLNYTFATLRQDTEAEPFKARIDGETIAAYPLKPQGGIRRPEPSAFEVIPRVSHSGSRYGIMASIRKRQQKIRPVVTSILEALSVETKAQYQTCLNRMHERTLDEQRKRHRYVMLVFRIRDNHGHSVNDYDMLLLAGNEYSPDILPKGFFVDRQKNPQSGHLVYYLDYDRMQTLKDDSFGIRIVARPDRGFTNYAPAEFRTTHPKKFLRPNETVMIDIILTRRIAADTFVLTPAGDKKHSFKKRSAGETVISEKGAHK